MEGNTITLSPHDMNCTTLGEIVTVEGHGYCWNCGAAKVRTSRGIWTEEWCPNGHSHAMWSK